MTDRQPSSPPKSISLFFSYAHEDEGLREELANRLALLERQGYISGWRERKISPGSEWKGQIDEHLESARIILLLVSPDFMASGYCFDVEMKRALERHKANEARVIPIILRHVNWQQGRFAKLQALPVNGRPVTDFPMRYKAFTEIEGGIRGVVRKLRGERAGLMEQIAFAWQNTSYRVRLFSMLAIVALLACLVAGMYFY
jgi:hypothetical protein